MEIVETGRFLGLPFKMRFYFLSKTDEIQLTLRLSCGHYLY